MCEHEHEWVPFLAHAEGFFSKRDDKGLADAKWFTGRVLSCAHQPCGTYLFIPNGAGLQPVECEMSAEAEAVAA